MNQDATCRYSWTLLVQVGTTWYLKRSLHIPSGTGFHFEKFASLWNLMTCPKLHYVVDMF